MTTPPKPEPYPHDVTPMSTLVASVKRAPNSLTAYLSAYGLFADGVREGNLSSLTRALDYVEFLETEFGLADFPDVALLRVSIQQSLPRNHSLYREYDRNALYAIYVHGSLIGTLRSTIIRNAAALDIGQVDPVAARALWPDGRPSFEPSVFPEVVAYVAYNPLDVSVNVHDSASAAAGWAIANIASGDYSRAFSTLEASRARANGFVSAAEHTAWLLLWYVTSRWEDARAAATTAKQQTMNGLGVVPGGIDQPVFDQLRRLAGVVGGFADLGLGDVAAARGQFSGVTVPDTPDTLAAWASYGLGMAYRVGEGTSPTESANMISTAVGMKSDARFTAALNDTSLKFRETTAANIAARTNYWDVDTEPDPALERKRKQQDMRETYRIRADRLLDAQIGMANVKDQVHRMISTITIERERARRGGTSKPVNYNLVLTGPPGTGKSTIVDVLALYFASLGIVDDPEPMVTHRADYVAETVGGSAIKTKNTIESAKGKVLFFDEFYSIVQVADGPNADQFGKEALDTIVAEAETRIGQLVFIIAGYESDIDRVVRVNEGLNSRFPRRIDFDTYSLAEIADIAELQATRSNLVLDPKAKAFIADENGEARNLLATTDTGDVLLNVLGNGRFARNLVETAAEFQAHRLVESGAQVQHLSDDDLSTLTLEDITASFNQHIENVLKHG